MTRGLETDPDIPFALNVRGSVPAEQALDLYNSLLVLLKKIGGTSIASEVEIFFNVPLLDLGYRRLPAENNGVLPTPREMSDEDLNILVKKFGELVRAARHEFGLSQARVAKEAGISQSYLSQIELAKNGANGPRRPIPSAVIGLARVLGMHEGALFDEAGYLPSEQPLD